jgi:hypothetical protein
VHPDPIDAPLEVAAVAHSAEARPRPARRAEPLQRLLFGAVYGTILASTTASALDTEGGVQDPGYDALWVFLPVLTSAIAHGYAHAVAHRAPDDDAITPTAVRSVLTEWPLVVAAVPTVLALLGAYAGLWAESGAVDVALLLNAGMLFGFGLWAARAAERGWGSSCRAGFVDMALGLLVVLANSVSH